jgi:hypothetical protein
MSSLYRKESRSYPYDASMQNLRKACARRKELGAYPRPWRSKEEALMVRRLVVLWFTCRDLNRPSGRDWARQLGISHTWLQKLVREFKTDPSEVRRLQAYGDPAAEQLDRTKKYTLRMRDRGELRSPCRRVPPAIDPAIEQFVQTRFTEGWSQSRLARELFLDRRTVKSILQKITQNSGQKTLARLPCP